MNRARKTLGVCILSALASAAVPAAAQQWEVGVSGGGTFYLNKSVSGKASGTAGFAPGWAAGGWLGHNSSGRYGGELHYQFQKTNLQTKAGGQSATFGGQSHVVHYDIVIHSNSREDAVRPFVAIGGGMKGYMGTGRESAFQPLSNVAILSKTQQWQPMLSFGAGVKWQISGRTMLRAEVRDFVTPFPKDVVLPAPGNKISGWIHDLVPTIGLSYLF
jgi:hypothetical protein